MKRNLTCKILYLILFFVFSGPLLYAQNDTTSRKNMVKLNVAALLLKSYSIQYERAVGSKISLALGARLMPKSSPPFKSKIEKLIDDPDTWENVKDFRTGNFAITPEVRFYLGKRVFQGFYVAPFARIAKYDAELPFVYDNGFVRETIPLSGSINTLTGGLLLGAQWKLSKLIHLDWWILGPNFGTASGTISGTKALSTQEQDVLRDELSNLDDIPLLKTTYTVDGNGAKVDVGGSWAGLRAGLNIGFRF